MTKQEYRAARKLLRENGNYALRWMRMSHASIMLQLEALAKKPDPYLYDNWRYTAKIN